MYLDVLTLARHTAGLPSHKMRLKRGCLVKDGPQVPESLLCSQQKPVLDHVDAEPPACVCGRAPSGPDSSWCQSQHTACTRQPLWGIEGRTFLGTDASDPRAP